jgi:hypothetical protein
LAKHHQLLRVAGLPLFAKKNGSAGNTKASVEKVIVPVIGQWKNGPRIKVVQSVSDLPGGTAPHDVEGAYAGNGVVYLVADNLPTEQRILEVLSHEAVGHAAMESMLGADLMAELTKEIGAWERRGSKLFVELGQAVDASQPNIKDQPTRRAKEIVALMAERGLHKQGSLWKKVTEAIKAWLRGQGFSGKWVASLPEDMVFQMLRDAERYLKNGNGGPGGPRGSRKNVQASLAYSRRGTAGFDGRVDDVLSGAADLRVAVELGDTPSVLQALGMSNHRLVTSGKVIDKLHFDHGLTAAKIKSLPALLDRPVMVFDSDTHDDGSMVVVTELVVRGKPVIAVIRPNASSGRATVNFLTTAFPKDKGEVIGRWVSDGLLRYRDQQKSHAWTTTVGLQLPKVVQPKHGRDSKVLTDADIFNGEGTNGTAPRGVEEAISPDAGGDRIAAARNAAGLNSPEGTIPSGEVTPGKPLFSRSSPRVVGDTIASLTGANHQHDSEFHEELRRLREADKTAWSKAKNWWKRNFYAGGLLPEGVFDAKIQRDGAFNAIEHDVRHLTGTLSAMVKKEYGKDLNKLSEADKALMAEALAGKWPGDAVKLETRSTLLAMRKYIDSLSGEYTKYLADKVVARLAADPEMDPRLNFAKSATKMSRLIWSQRFLDLVREIGVGTFLVDADSKPAIVPSNTRHAPER